MGVIRLNAISDVYVSPAEFGNWVRDWVRAHNLHYLFARLYFRDEARPRFEVCRELAWADRGLVTRTVRDYSQLYLSVVPLNADVPNINLLAVANTDRLRVNLPVFSARGMKGLGLELACRSRSHGKVYEAIVADLRDRTEAGAWFRQARHKREWFDPDCRYSPGAVLLLEQGVPLSAGGNIVVSRFGAGRKRGTKPAEPAAAPDPARM